MKRAFIILTGRHKGKMLNLPAEKVIVGRDEAAQIRVNSTEVSRQHCEIRLEGNQVIVKDLGSRNGTFVNGEVIFGEQAMFPGDTLHVGAMVFELAGKKKATPAARKKPAKPPGSRASIPPPSDAELIDWLAEDDSVPIPDSDTTIVTNKEASAMGLPEEEVIQPREQTVDMKPINPGSTAAEAADVIRQYWKEQG